MGASAGRVLIIPKGNWNAETTYTGLDMVRHNGASWICKNTCTNIEPTEANVDNWQMMSMDGTDITVDSEVSSESENPVQNKVIKKYVDEHAVNITVDSEVSSESENPVQNKVIKKYVDDKQVNIDGTTLTMDQVNNVIKLADTLKEKINGALPSANVVNNLTTTEAGFALDARQANPNVDGTLAKQLSDLNGSLMNNLFYGQQVSSIKDIGSVGLYFITNASEMPTDNPFIVYSWGVKGRSWNHPIFAFDTYSGSHLYIGRMSTSDGVKYTFSGWTQIQTN